MYRSESETLAQPPETRRVREIHIFVIAVDETGFTVDFQPPLTGAEDDDVSAWFDEPYDGPDDGPAAASEANWGVTASVGILARHGWLRADEWFDAAGLLHVRMTKEEA